MKLSKRLQFAVANLSICTAIFSTPSWAETPPHNSLRTCVHKIVYMTALSYACIEIVNTDAHAHGGPNQIVNPERRPGGADGADGAEVEYSSRSYKSICGRMGFPIPRTIAPSASEAATALMRDLFDSFISQLDSIDDVGTSVADLELNRKQGVQLRSAENKFRSKLRLYVDDLLAKFVAAIRVVPKDRTVQVDQETCSIAIDGSRVLLPQPTPPDLPTLRKWPIVEKNYLATASRLRDLMPPSDPKVEQRK